MALNESFVLNESQNRREISIYEFCLVVTFYE